MVSGPASKPGKTTCSFLVQGTLNFGWSAESDVSKLNKQQAFITIQLKQIKYRPKCKESGKDTDT